MGLLGWVGLVYLEARSYQQSEERALMEIRRQFRAPKGPLPKRAAPGAGSDVASVPRQVGRVVDPGLIGRIEIPRLGVAAIVREGTSRRTLELAVGHVGGTALPGQHGNVGLAAHRDTYFRRLAGIRKNDTIRITTPDAIWEYTVQSTAVVDPEAVDVLAATDDATLTLVTCYPFGYVGPAPRRFIVRARQTGPPKAGN
jgi:sortase A